MIQPYIKQPSAYNLVEGFIVSRASSRRGNSLPSCQGGFDSHSPLHFTNPARNKVGLHSFQEMSMRWKPLEGRELPNWVGYPMMVVFIPLIIGVFGPLFAMVWLEKQKRKLIGPRDEWSSWYAWHPVRSDRGFGNAVWLEWVERRVWYGQVEHRTLEEAKARA